MNLLHIRPNNPSWKGLEGFVSGASFTSLLVPLFERRLRADFGLA